MRKINLIAVLLLLSLVLVSAQEQQTLGGVDGYSPGEDIELIQTCANCTMINITYINLGNGTNYKVDEPMTKDGTFYNYTLVSIYTLSLGEYIVNWEADPDGEASSGNYNFFVRRGGVLLTTSESMLYILLMVVTFLGTWFFLFFAMRFPYSDDRTEDGTVSQLIPQKYLKLLSIWLAYGSFLWLMNLLTGIVNTFISLEIALTLVTNLYLFMYYLAYGLTAIILVLMFIEWWKDLIVPFVIFLLRKASRRKKRV